jgi:hypothetical protein
MSFGNFAFYDLFSDIETKHQKLNWMRALLRRLSQPATWVRALDRSRHLNGFRNDGAPSDEVVVPGQDEARPRELVRAGLAGLAAGQRLEEPLSAFFATYIFFVNY